jgi:hypothetical protein
MKQINYLLDYLEKGLIILKAEYDNNSFKETVKSGKIDNGIRKIQPQSMNIS